MKVIHELIEKIEKADASNFETMKPALLKLAKMSALSLGEQDRRLSPKKIDEIYRLWMIPYNVAYELHDEVQVIIGKLNHEFVRVYTTLVDGMCDRGYFKDGRTLCELVLRGLGGKARWIKLQMGKRKKLLAYAESQEYLADLKSEIDKQLREQSLESIYASIVQINGLIVMIKEHLDESSRNLAGTIRAMASMDGRSMLELEADEVLGEYFNPQYPKELRRRIYLWDQLTVNLRNEYSVDEILED